MSTPMQKTAIDPVFADSLKMGVGGLGVGALLAALTNATPKIIDTEFKPRKIEKVIPKRVVPQPIYVDEAMAQRLAEKGIAVRHATTKPKQTAIDEDEGIDPMQKVANGDDANGGTIAKSLLGGAKVMAPLIAGGAALGGGFYLTDKALDAHRRKKARAAYMLKRRELNRLISGADEAVAGLDKVAEPFEAALPWLLKKAGWFEDIVAPALPWAIGVPAIVGGAMTFGQGQEEAIEKNPNIAKIEELDKFYADMHDTPKLQLTPVLRPKPKKKKKVAAPPQLAKVAAFRVNLKPAASSPGVLRRLFAEEGKANDLLSAGASAASYVPAHFLSQNIDDPTYKWMERGLMPLSVGMLLNRRLNSKGLKPTVWGGVGAETGIFGGLRALDTGSNRLPKALEAQAAAAREAAQHTKETADKALKWGGVGLGGGIAALLGSQIYGNVQERKESRSARRSQSRQLSKILKGVGVRHPGAAGDTDGDGDVDEDDRALAAAGGVVADPDKRKH